MSLPTDHKCEGPGCDPEDEDHRELRLKLQNRAKVRAGFKADQAWAKARDAMPALIRVRNKLSGKAPLIPEDVEVIEMALCLILGELFLRQADRY